MLGFTIQKQNIFNYIGKAEAICITTNGYINKQCAIHTLDEIRNKLDYMLEMGEKIFYTEKII